MNVLVVPGIKCRRGSSPHRLLMRRSIFISKCIQQGSGWSRGSLWSATWPCDWVQGEDFEVYDTHEEAVRRLEDLAEQGVACCLIADPAWAWGDIVAAGGAGVAGMLLCVPVLLVGEPERPPRGPTGRRCWRATFSALIVSPEFFSERFWLEVQRDRWRPFCFRALPAAFDLIIGLMLQTYDAWPGLRDDPERSKALTKLFQWIARYCAACVLHVGPTSTLDKD